MRYEVSQEPKDVEPGDIILLHDFYGSSVDAALEHRALLHGR